MNKEALYDLIERHIQNKLTDIEVKQVEELRLHDPSFTQEIELHREIQHALGDKGLRDFKQKIKEADKIYFTSTINTAAQRRVIPFYLKIAASIAAVIISVSTIIYFISNNSAPDKNLFNAYFNPYEAPINFRSADSPDTDNTFNQALTFYNEKNYQRAIPLLTNIIVTRPDNMLVFLLRGTSYLASGNTTQAESDFNSVIRHRQNMFVEQAKWYLALTYLKQDRRKEAIELLHSLEHSVYQEKAQKLLSDLV